ncbi:MAG: phosphodiester glycosidase family protein [Oscillospiraceae bacterium]
MQHLKERNKSAVSRERSNGFVKNDIKTVSYKSPRSRVKTIVLRSLSVLGVLLLAFIVCFFSVTTIITKGPSKTARDMFVTTVMETSAAKFLARMYFSEAQIKEIQAKNNLVDTGEVTDTNVEFEPPKEEVVPEKAIEIFDVVGGTYKGKMMVVHDPSRLKVATLPQFDREKSGMTVEAMIKAEGAIAGINAGGFEDKGGVGKGGMPLGFVIKDSKLVFGTEKTGGSIIGIDKNNRLIVGILTAGEALKKNVRDAVTFGPALITNSVPTKSPGTGGGLNPRTAIGQRADGALLILVIDGRQSHSIGASYKDLIDVMVEYKAVNAGNLDGGASAVMYYQGELVTTCASLTGPRDLPTAFVIK